MILLAIMIEKNSNNNTGTNIVCNFQERVTQKRIGLFQKET